jgi:hypothetical protein
MHDLLARMRQLLAMIEAYRLGVSVEDQCRPDERLPVLCETPAAIRWASVEPLPEPVDLRPWLAGLDWVIVGGESGPEAVLSIWNGRGLFWGNAARRAFRASSNKWARTRSMLAIRSCSTT